MSHDGSTKHPSLESQRRRPSSIAEQAMRKLGISSHSQLSNLPQQSVQLTQQQQQQQTSNQRSESPVSPRHSAALSTVPTISSNDCNLLDNNINSSSVITTTVVLRDTNIREQVPVVPPLIRENSYLRNSTLTNSIMNSTTLQTIRDRSECTLPYISSTSATIGQYGSLIGARDNSCLLSRESCITPMNITHRTPSSRFLTSGIDQRIIKQSTEDCRRLLQQVF